MHTVRIDQTTARIIKENANIERAAALALTINWSNKKDPFFS